MSNVHLMAKIGKRRSPDYTQIFGYIPKDLALKFRTLCTAKELEQSEVIEMLVRKWVSEEEEKS